MAWDWDRLKEQQQRMSGQPPQMNEIFNKLRNMKFPGGPLLILLVAIIALATSMVYTIDLDEVGIVQRFGRYVRIEQPGLNFKFPAGIEKVTKVKIKRIYKEEFGAGVATEGRRFMTDSEGAGVSLMLTGDLNVAVVPWIVQYRIRDPYNFLYRVRDVRSLLTDMSEATMRLVVGDRSINEVISKREEIALKAQEVLQEEMNEAQAGIQIVTIEMKRTNVPGPVQPSFNEVNQAVQEKEQTIYQAREEYNKAVPAAKGEAERIIEAAEGYNLSRINRAQGDAARFKSQYDAYAKAKDVTRRRLYLETIGSMLPKLGQKYIVDADQRNLLPLLNLGKESGSAK